MPTAHDESVGLKRSLNLPMITFYGLGTIVGGGFYALSGKVAGEAGMLAPWAFLAAALIALFSAFSFAELSARFPVSGGEAHYVGQAFGRKWLSTTIGWMVIATGVVSAATLANAFAGFSPRLVDAPPWLIVAAAGVAGQSHQRDPARGLHVCESLPVEDQAPQPLSA